MYRGPELPASSFGSDTQGFRLPARMTRWIKPPRRRAPFLAVRRFFYQNDHERGRSWINGPIMASIRRRAAELRVRQLPLAPTSIENELLRTGRDVWDQLPPCSAPGESADPTDASLRQAEVRAGARDQILRHDPPPSSGSDAGDLPRLW